ncbi:unnamed protein product [Nesidiocoris tenuis]|uniref:Homeobox domain-containing protein n=1 Tax=Nesidiocoris tenuis TaxID=355587 RepID=A0A6H5GB86_9HEMI|nr:unnamed protein product [Nesidiocoris tenuis]
MDNSLRHKDDDGRCSQGGGLSKKQRKARTAFTDHQLQTLEKSFERQKYLSVQDRMELAAKLSLSDTQVKTWYQNRRKFSWQQKSISVSTRSNQPLTKKSSKNQSYLWQKSVFATIRLSLQHFDFMNEGVVY